MLEVTQLSAGYAGVVVIRDVSLTVAPGEILTVLGANGAGKSTLIRALGGLLPVRAGRVSLDGEDITRTDAAARVRRGVAQVPEGRHLFADMTVRENLELGNYSGRGSRDSIDRVLSLFPALERFSRVRAGSLSGGQQQMLAVGRALMSDPRLLLMDEPSLGLAPMVVDEILLVVRQLAKDGAAIVLAEQNARKSLRVADRALFLDSGRITLSGDPDELANDPAVLHAYFGVEPHE